MISLREDAGFFRFAGKLYPVKRSGNCTFFPAEFLPDPKGIMSWEAVCNGNGLNLCWEKCQETCCYTAMPKVVVFNGRIYPIKRPSWCQVKFSNSLFMVCDFSLELLQKNILCLSRCTWGKDHGC